MSTPQYPSVEVIQRSDDPERGTRPRGRRWKLFLGVLVIASAVGTAFVYARTPVYRASVSVLTVKPKAVDMPSAVADAQHVAIQERLLLGEEIIDRLSERFRQAGDELLTYRSKLRGILSVATVPETNLLELRAQGEHPEKLQRVVNEWAGTYETLRLEEIASEAGRTNTELTEEQQQIQEKIEIARAELAAFRDAHDIVSLEREENRKISALKGINKSLNRAREQLVKARASQAAIENAIARGETVAPREQKAEISKLRVTIGRETAKLANLRARFTDLYISKDPKFRDLPATLELHQQELEAALEIGRTSVREEARQAVEAARVSVTALEQQQADDQQRVQLFTERFNEFKVLEERLATLEQLHAERERRLAQIDVKNEQKYPPMQVVEWARVPNEPISPDYERDLAIALAAALGIALFVTWLVEYLGGRPEGAAPAPVLGVRVAHVDAPADASLPRGAERDPLPHLPDSRGEGPTDERR